jgi:hypothetical protein
VLLIVACVRAQTLVGLKMRPYQEQALTWLLTRENLSGSAVLDAISEYVAALGRSVGGAKPSEGDVRAAAAAAAAAAGRAGGARHTCACRVAAAVAARR